MAPHCTSPSPKHPASVGLDRSGCVPLTHPVECSVDTLDTAPQSPMWHQQTGKRPGGGGVVRVNRRLGLSVLSLILWLERDSGLPVQGICQGAPPRCLITPHVRCHNPTSPLPHSTRDNSQLVGYTSPQCPGCPAVSVGTPRGTSTLITQEADGKAAGGTLGSTIGCGAP